MNTHLAIFLYAVLVLIFICSEYELGRVIRREISIAIGRAEAYKEEAYLKSIGRKKTSRWKPEKGGKYYYVGDSGMVNFTFADCDSVDEAYYKFGNVFRTEEEAQRALEKVKETLINFHKENE
jgi:hypothetical protein